MDNFDLDLTKDQIKILITEQTEILDTLVEQKDEIWTEIKKHMKIIEELMILLSASDMKSFLNTLDYHTKETLKKSIN